MCRSCLQFWGTPYLNISNCSLVFKLILRLSSYSTFLSFYSFFVCDLYFYLHSKSLLCCLLIFRMHLFSFNYQYLLIIYWTGEGRHLPWSAAAFIRRQAAWGRPYPCRLQRSERIHYSQFAPFAWWLWSQTGQVYFLSFCIDFVIVDFISNSTTTQVARYDLASKIVTLSVSKCRTHFTRAICDVEYGIDASQRNSKSRWRGHKETRRKLHRPI